MARPLIFDLDGTLVDSCAICVAILSDMLAQRGSSHRIDMDYARPFMSIGGQAMVAALLGPACGDPAEEIAEFRRRYAVHDTARDTLFPHVADGLARLVAAGHRLAICSNKPQNLCEKVLADTGLSPHFAAIIGTTPDRRSKPAPDLLDLTLAALKTDAADCLFIGDSELDHQVADAAGMPFLFLTHGYAHADYVADPAFSYDCFGVLTGDILAGRHG
ncbi:HAD hydrolase-like protein [Novosphingobium sp. FSY-8]|uniref:phosphoglycolate phosphatase n=1 Tax=Novosphingobium ovatum TaxID=1908523 RepID=A0ABW9XIE0_9SPHN|nr:HAD hydrolase-like protein [Novosphingobium ovatum]NBC38177.1 HAD hydrolase-like protein [Novosphingobium ovatum]